MRKMNPAVKRVIRLFHLRWQAIVPTMGFLFLLGIWESPIDSSSNLSRMRVAEHIGQILQVLEIFMTESPLQKTLPPIAYSDLPENTSNAAKVVLVQGIMEGFPDKEFHPDENLRLGELISNWAQLIKFLNKSAKVRPPPDRIITSIRGLGEKHWMSEDLKTLAGIGAFPGRIPEAFEFSRIANDLDIAELMKTTLGFFGRDNVIFVRNEKEVRLFFKGASQEIPGTGWMFRTSETEWRELPEAPIIGLDPGKATTIYLKHPSFEIVHYETDSSENKSPNEEISGPESYCTKVVPLKEILQSLPRQIAEPVRADKDEKQSVRWNPLKKGEKAPFLGEPPGKCFGWTPSPGEPPGKCYGNPSPGELPANGLGTPLRGASPSGWTPPSVALTPAPSRKEPVPAKEVEESKAAEKKLPETETAESSDIWGSVVDAISKKPVRNAQVVIDGLLCVTGENGKFNFYEMKKDLVAEILVTAKNFQSLSMKHRVGFRNKALRVNLNPYRSALKAQIVSSVTGHPVPGAVASFSNGVFTANSSGRFEIRNSEPGYHTIEVKAPGFQDSRELVFIAETPSNRVLRIHPQLVEASTSVK